MSERIYRPYLELRLNLKSSCTSPPGAMGTSARGRCSEKSIFSCFARPKKRDARKRPAYALAKFLMGSGVAIKGQYYPKPETG